MSDKFVNIIDNLGEVYSIPERFVGQEIDAGRIKGLATPEQVAKAKRDLKYGTPGQMAITAAEGAAKGLSLGVSPWIEKQLGVNPADIAARAETNPITSGGTELAGMLAPTVLTGGAGAGKGVLSLAGKALAKTPVGLLEKAGKAAELGVEALGGTGMASRAAAATTSGALWGGAYGAGEAIGEAALGDDPQLNAESLLASIGTGVLLGGGISGVGRLLGSTLAKGSKKLSEKTSPDMIQKFSDARAFEALGEGQLQMKQLERAQKQFGKGFKEEIGSISKDEWLLKGLVNSAEDINERAVIAKNRLGKELESTYAKIDESAIARHPDKAELAEELRVNVLIPLQQSGARVDRDLAETIQKKYLDYFLEPGEQIQKGVDDKLSFTDLWNKRKFLDKHINYDLTGKPAGALDSSLMKARGVIEEYLENKAQDAASSIGEDFLSGYRATKRKYSAMSVAASISGKRDMINQTHQSMGIEPLITGALVGGATSLATGDMSMGAAGAALGGFAASRFQQQVSTLIKKYGSSAMAVGLDDIGAKVSGVQSTIKKAMDSLAAPQKVAPMAMILGAGEPIKGRYDETAKKYDQLTPDAVNTTIENKLRVMGPVAPTTLAALKTTAIAAVQHIQAAKPKAIDREDDLFTGLDKRSQASDRAMARWLRVVAAAENPIGVIKSAGNGSLTAEGADVLRTVYPGLYNAASKQLISRFGAAKVRPDSSKTRTASMFLGAPVASNHSPRFTARCQQAYIRQPAEPRPPKTNVSIDKNIKSQFSGSQALEARKV